MSCRSERQAARKVRHRDAIDTAWHIHTAIADWTGKVDVKASFTLTIESALLAGVATFSAKDRLLSGRDGHWEQGAFWSGVGLITVGVLLAGLTVRPRLRKRKSKADAQDNFIYFGHLRHWEEKRLTKTLLTRDVLPVLSRQLIATSGIAWAKHRRVQWSLLLAAAGAALIVGVGFSIQY